MTARYCKGSANCSSFLFQLEAHWDSPFALFTILRLHEMGLTLAANLQLLNSCLLYAYDQLTDHGRSISGMHDVGNGLFLLSSKKQLPLHFPLVSWILRTTHAGREFAASTIAQEIGLHQLLHKLYTCNTSSIAYKPRSSYIVQKHINIAHWSWRSSKTIHQTSVCLQIKIFQTSSQRFMRHVTRIAHMLGMGQGWC